MKLDEKQYERIGRFLDGEDIALTSAERAAAEELRGDLALLGEAEGPAPRAALDQAHRQMMAEPARPRHHFPWRRWAVAAAAIVVFACGLWALHVARETEHVPTRWQIAEVPLEQAVDAMEHSAVLADLEQLADEISEFRADLLAWAQDNPTELKLDAIEKELNTLWIEDLDADSLLGAG